VAVYGAFVSGILNVAKRTVRLVQPDELRHQLTVILGFAALLSGTIAVGSGAFESISFPDRFDVAAFEVLILLVIVAGVIGALRADDRVVVLTSVGVANFAIALIYVLFSAPDLAITQVLVETLVVILAALILIRLPSGSLRNRASGGVPPRAKLFAVGVATLVGVLFSGLLLAVVSLPFDRSVTIAYEQLSYPAAFGRNIVNVILVDFRAIDTLGEITVLAVAALGVLGLLRRRRTPGKPSAADPVVTHGSLEGPK
jgi:multicomponent Na+:H+ antiporter subunit A